jgi:L-asparagine oxygenase
MAAIAVMAAINHQLVSYGSENGGASFVNLAVMPGEGKTAEKSKVPMRGHTDAVSFPPRGQADPEHQKIAPSPDFVCLVGLKNPDLVETTVMPMPAILARLSRRSIDQLTLQQFQIRAQTTFLQGTKRILGEAHIADGVAVLYGIDGQLGVRYSHTNVLAEENADADAALQELQQACSECVEKGVVNPGDILLVNNRFALHGRSEVGKNYGGQSHRLLRTYGLLNDAARPDQYHPGSTFMLFP